MTVSINFYASNGSTIHHLAGSGLAFFGASFGQSIAVGEYNKKTYVSNGAGTTQGPECWNIRYQDAASGIVAEAGSGIALTAVPNYQASLRVEVSSDDGEITVPSAYVSFYDRSSTSNAPSGVSAFIAELVHPGDTQANEGSGSAQWHYPEGTGVLYLWPSPGTSGQYAASDSTWSSLSHDFYLAVSCGPESIGGKTFGLFFGAEWL